jgi:hypothetical protein
MTRSAGALIVLGAFVASGARSSDARACAVSGEKVVFGGSVPDFDADVLVRPPGGKSFRLTRVSADRVTAQIPSTATGRTPIEVHNVISFSGTTEPLSFRVTQPVESADKMVKLYPSAEVRHAASDGPDVVGAVVVSTPDETVEPVRIPCDALVLKFPGRSPDREPIGGDGTWWKPRRAVRRFVLRARPDDHAPAVTLAIQGQSDHADRLSFKRLSAEGSWTQIAREGFGVVATGWARTSSLRQLPGAPDVSGSGGGPVPGAGYHGYTARNEKGYYLGPAHIAVGTTLFAEPGRQPWGKVEKDGVFVIVDRGDAWVGVLEIPGVEGPDVPALVPAAAVRRGP